MIYNDDSDDHDSDNDDDSDDDDDDDDSIYIYIYIHAPHYTDELPAELDADENKDKSFWRCG